MHLVEPLCLRLNERLMNLRMLITGASGFVGQRVYAQALRDGFVVRGALRRHGEAPAIFDSVVVGEINDATDWSQVLRDVDVVIHLAARVHVMKDNAIDPLGEFRRVNTDGTENLARQAAQAGVKRLVYVSSIKVNGEATQGGDRFSELDAPLPQDPYGVSKWEAEQALHRVALETGLEIVIVRPPLVYGVGVKANFAQMIKVLYQNFPLPLASVRNSLSLIYVDNLVNALILCATHPHAAGQTYLVSDGEDISTPDLLRQLGAAMGHSARLFACPVTLLKLAGRLTGRADQIERLTGSLQIDSGKIRRELGWTPPYSVSQGLQLTAKSSKQS